MTMHSVIGRPGLLRAGAGARPLAFRGFTLDMRAARVPLLSLTGEKLRPTLDLYTRAGYEWPARYTLELLPLTLLLARSLVFFVAR